MISGRRTKLNNGGFSLVELIVVIMIMAIVSGGAAVGISVAYNARSESATKKLVSMMDKAREEAMARIESETSLVISSDGSDITASVTVKKNGTTTVIASEKLGNTHISITFKGYEGGNISGTAMTPISVSDSQPVTITYNAASGSLLNVSSNGSINNTTPALNVYKFTDIEIAGTDSYQVIIIPETGRVFIK